MRATCHDGDHDFAVSNVRGLVHPTALHAGSRIHLGQGRKTPAPRLPLPAWPLTPRSRRLKSTAFQLSADSRNPVSRAKKCLRPCPSLGSPSKSSVHLFTAQGACSTTSWENSSRRSTECLNPGPPRRNKFCCSYWMNFIISAACSLSRSRLPSCEFGSCARVVYFRRNGVSSSALGPLLASGCSEAASNILHSSWHPASV